MLLFFLEKRGQELTYLAKKSIEKVQADVHQVKLLPLLHLHKVRL